MEVKQAGETISTHYTHPHAFARGSLRPWRGRRKSAWPELELVLLVLPLSVGKASKCRFAPGAACSVVNSLA